MNNKIIFQFSSYIKTKFKNSSSNNNFFILTICVTEYFTFMKNCSLQSKLSQTQPQSTNRNDEVLLTGSEILGMQTMLGIVMLHACNFVVPRGACSLKLTLYFALADSNHYFLCPTHESILIKLNPQRTLSSKSNNRPWHKQEHRQRNIQHKITSIKQRNEGHKWKGKHATLWARAHWPLCSTTSGRALWRGYLFP